MDAETLNKLQLGDLKNMCEMRHLNREGSKANVVLRLLQHEDKSDSRKPSVSNPSQASVDHASRHSGNIADTSHQSVKQEEQHTQQPPKLKSMKELRMAHKALPKVAGSHSNSQLHHNQIDEEDTRGFLGICAACNEPITHQVIMALDKNWHHRHFVCVECREQLSTNKFFEHNGEPYCEHDYHKLFSPRCASCLGIISHNCVNALGKTWHPEHFVCGGCGEQITEKSFHVKDGHPYCSSDYYSLFAPKCAACHDDIMGTYVTAVYKKWHQDCFRCNDCGTPLKGTPFFNRGGLPYCSFCDQNFKTHGQGSSHTAYQIKDTPMAKAGYGGHIRASAPTFTESFVPPPHSEPVDHGGREVIGTNTSRNTRTSIVNGLKIVTVITTTTYRYADGTSKEVVSEDVQSYNE